MWEEAIYMPTSVSCVTEEHFVVVEGAFKLPYLALGVLDGGATVRIREGWCGCGRG